MTKLLITEITIMAPGFCVIGLEHKGENFISIRPLPRRGAAWLHFPYHRGDVLEVALWELPVLPPHIEDRGSKGIQHKVSQVAEEDIVKYLRRAEVAANAEGLFGCRMQSVPKSGHHYVRPQEASRSICGCAPRSLQLEMVGNVLRGSLALPSGEVLRDLPVVDRDWREFVSAATEANRGANRYQRLKKFFDLQLPRRLMESPHHFVRIGLTRPLRGCCWVMVDTLFPLPQPSWLNEF
jgi:hypothetical protein